MKKCLGLGMLMLLFAAVAVQAGNCSDCTGCYSGNVEGLMCRYSGSIPNCPLNVCDTSGNGCQGDTTFGDCVYGSSCNCWFFVQMYWTRYQPAQHYDSHQWHLVRTHVTTAPVIARKRA
jgi:hypothetical protein